MFKNMISPFEVCYNNYRADYFLKRVSHYILNSYISQNSYYLGNERITIQSTEKSDYYNKYRNFICDNTDLLVFKGETEFRTLIKNINPRLLKIKINPEKIEDNKSFLKKFFLNLFDKYRIYNIYGILAIDSRNKYRILNLTHFYISSLIVNGLISLENYDEFYIFTYDSEISNLLKEEGITEYKEKLNNLINILLPMYLQFRTDLKNGITYTPIQIHNNCLEMFIEGYTENKIKNWYIPVHLANTHIFYPYYGNLYVELNDDSFTSYDIFNHFYSGNTQNSSICTGNENRYSYYGLTTLEVFNTNSAYFSRTLRNDYLDFVEANISLSLENYLQGD